MSALALGIATALVALRCQLISDDPYVLGSVSRVIPATRPAFVRALNQTRRAIGCPVGGDVVEPPPLFAGGQCAGKRYRYQYNVISAEGVAGPFTVVQCAANRFGPITLRREQNGVQVSWFLGSANASGDRTETMVASSNSQITVNLQIISTCDFTADNCGSPDPNYPSPTNITNNIDVTYEGDEGDINVTLPFVFAPITVNFDGTLRIPFTFDLGGFEFSGDINLPDFNVTLNRPGLPPGSREDLSDEGEDGPGESVEPAPPGEKIIGVVVNATQIDSRRVSSYSSPGITPIFVPRLGSIKFAYSIGIATFFSSDIDIKDRRTFIPCPFSQGADAVIASPNLGVDLTFTPIRGYPLATTGDFPPPT